MSEVEQTGFRHSGPEVAGPRAHDGSPEVAGPRAHDGSPEVAPRVFVDHGPEVRPSDSVEDFIGRLTGLGATIDEVEAVRAAWDQDWSSETFSKRDLLHMSDEQLTTLIEAGRREYVEGTMTEDEQAAAERKLGVVEQSDGAAHQVSVGSVDDVLAWVGDDVVRAEAAFTAESEQDEHPARVTLLRKLASVAGLVYEA